MRLQIDNDYRITSDRYQWIVQKRRSRVQDGKRRSDWEAQSYYTTLRSALAQLGERMVRESNADTVVDALEVINDIATTLSQALTPQLELLLAANDETMDAE